jgi:hypothetical protein
VIKEINPILDRYKVSSIDLLRTFTEHIAQQITLKLKSNTACWL